MDSNIGVFLLIFKSTFSYRTLPVVASEIWEDVTTIFVSVRRLFDKKKKIVEIEYIKCTFYKLTTMHSKVYKFTKIKNTAQKMKFSVKDFFSKCDRIHRKLRIWSHLLKTSLTENFIFCAVKVSPGFSKVRKTQI